MVELFAIELAIAVKALTIGSAVPHELVKIRELQKNSHILLSSAFFSHTDISDLQRDRSSLLFWRQQLQLQVRSSNVKTEYYLQKIKSAIRLRRRPGHVGNMWKLLKKISLGLKITRQSH